MGSTRLGVALNPEEYQLYEKLVLIFSLYPDGPVNLETLVSCFRLPFNLDLTLMSMICTLLQPTRKWFQNIQTALSHWPRSGPVMSSFRRHPNTVSYPLLHDDTRYHVQGAFISHSLSYGYFSHQNISIYPYIGHFNVDLPLNTWALYWRIKILFRRK